MLNSRKLFSAFLTMAMSVSVVAPVVAAFSDEDMIASYAKGAVMKLSDDSIIKGTNGEFRPTQNMTRSEFLKVALLAANQYADSSYAIDEAMTTNDTGFSDLDGHWSLPYVATAKSEGLVGGKTATTFAPNDNISRAEASKVLVNVFNIDSEAIDATDEEFAEIFSDVAVTDWFFPYVKTMYYWSVTSGYADGSFGANDPITRQDAAAMMIGKSDDEGALAEMAGVVQPVKRSADAVSDDDDDEVLQAGVLEIELSDESPASMDIPKTAQGITYAVYDFTAGDEDVTINGLKFYRKGFGSDEDFDKLWLSKDGVIISSDKSVSSSDDLYFAINFEVEAGETETIALIAAMQTTLTGRSNYFALNTADDVFSTAEEVEGDFPVEGNIMRTIDYTVAELTLSHKGSDSQVDIGAKETIGEFKLDETESSSSQSVELKSIRLKNTGTGDVSNLEEIELYQGADVVSRDIYVDGDYVTFVLEDDFIIEDAKSKLFAIKAEIVRGDDGDTYQFDLKNTFDVYGLELGTAVGVAVVDSSTMKTYTVNAGKFTVSLDTSSPSSEEYKKDTDDVLLLVAKVDVDQPVKVDQLRVYISADTDMGGDSVADDITDIEAGFENFKVYINDTVIDSQDSITNADGAGTAVVLDTDYLKFDSNFTIEDDDLIKIYADIKRDAVTASELKVKIDNTGINKSFQDVEYIYNGESVKDTDHSGSATSNQVEIVSTSEGVSVTRNDGYADGETFIAGVQDAEFMQFVVNAGSASSMEIDKLNFDFAYVDSDLTYSNFTNLKVFIDGEQAGTTEDLQNGTPDSVTFENLDINIAKSGQTTISLVGNIDTSAIADEFTITLDADESVFFDSDSDEITYTTDVASASDMEVVENGVLTVSLDANSPDTAILVADTDAVEVAKLKFEAQFGDVNVKDVFFANIDNVTADNIITTADARVSSYELVVGGEVLDTKVPSAGKVHFNLASDKYIEVVKDESVVATVRANLNSITSANETNKAITLELRDLEAETKATSKALTVASSVAINRADNYDNTGLAASDIAAEVQYVRKTQPTLAAQALSSTVLTSGTKTMYKVNVAADNTEDLVVGAIAFKVSGKIAGDAVDGVVGSTLVTDAAGTPVTALDSFKLYINGTDKTSDGAFTFAEIGTTDTFKITFTFTDGKDEEVSKGGVTTFELKANIIGVVDNDYVTTEILEDTTADSGAFAAVPAADYYFVWSDNAGSPHDRTTADWFNGNEVEGLDTDAVTLEK